MECTGSRAEFADVYASSLLGGGANQVGSGVKLANVSQQFDQGTISCTNACSLNTSNCSYLCGDDGIDPGETCDGTALAGMVKGTTSQYSYTSFIPS